MRKRIAFDMLLTVALVFEMFYQVTGNALHELVGALFFVCVVVHVAFNRAWIARMPSSAKSGALGRRNRLLAVVAGLLAVDTVVLGVSSLAISETLWNAGVNMSWLLNLGTVWYPVHVGSSYALCVLVLVHLSLHWAVVAESLGVAYDPARREAINQGVNALTVMGAIALGIGGLMRTSFEASDFSVASDSSDATPEKTVSSGYRERNAETGKTVEGAVAVKTYAESDSASDENAGASSDSAAADALCPLCPRQCKLSAPRCERPSEQGLI